MTPPPIPHFEFWDSVVFLELLAAVATAIAFICIAFTRRR